MTALIVRRTVIVLVTLTLLVAALLFAARIPKTIAIFVIAGFIAFGAHPLVRWLEVRMPRPAAIFVVYAVLLGALAVVAFVVVPVTVAQLGVLVRHTPDYVAGSEDVVSHIERTLRGAFGDRIPLPSAADVQGEVGTRVTAFLDATVAQVGGLIVGAFSALLIAISALILSVFLLLQGGEVREGILAFVPPPRRPGMHALLDELTDVFGHFVAGQALLCAIVGFAVWLVLAPAHFAFALLVALVCGFGYAVPFVGQIVAHVVAALLALPQGTGMLIWAQVGIFIIFRVADSLLVPKIMAESLGVSPITVMFAVFAGGELFGIPGLILGIPAAALLKVLFGYFVQPYVLRMQSAGAETNVHVDVAVESATPREDEPAETVVVSVGP
jgi:predicted PurR-regulated permease PerM